MAQSLEKSLSELAGQVGIQSAEVSAAQILAAVKTFMDAGLLEFGAIADGQYLKRVGETIEGGTPAGGSGLPSQWTEGANGNVTATVDDDAATPFTLQAKVGQTGHLFRWYDENSVLQGDIDFAGVLDVTHLVVQSPPDAGANERSISLQGSIGKITVTSLLPSDVPLEFRAPFGLGHQAYWAIKSPGRGADNGYVEFSQLNGADTMFLMIAHATPVSDHWQIWNGAFDRKLFRILSDGAIGTSAHSAPPDADFAAGDMALWFDQTDGAAKLKIKGKSADGTVVQGEVALS